jgi:FlaA1/EpsC-like NDP-sugar epimerase
MHRVMEGVNIVIHAAALKHVVLCEQSPADALQTNIIGTQNVIDAAVRNGVERVVFTSSDKAVNPTNVMGTSKLMGERLITAANALRRGRGPVFASTRFGNVLGSRGSVVPIFKRQILRGGPITITDLDMTRFVMTLSEAAALVMDSVFKARGGEVFITKMPVVRIADVARVMVQELSRQHGLDEGKIDTQVIGSKAGEKLYEELMSEEETRRTVELEKYYCVLPAFKTVYRSIDYDYEGMLAPRVLEPYNSTLVEPLSVRQVAEYLRNGSLLD